MAFPLGSVLRIHRDQWQMVRARLDNRRVIVAASAGELSIKVVDDHTERPVPRPGVSDEKAKP